MSTTGSPTHESALLNQQVDMLARDAAALSGAISRGRAIRLVLFVGLVALIAWIVITSYQVGNRVINSPDYHKQLLDEFQNYVAAHQKDYSLQLQNLYTNTSPVITRAFYAQAKKDIPLYLSYAQKQTDTVIEDLNKKMTDRLTKRYDRLLSDRQDLIKNSFPDIKDEREQVRLQKNMEVAINNLIKRHYIDKMDDQVRLVISEWDTFPTAPPRQPQTESLEDQFVGQLMELMTYRLSHTSNMYNATP
jgi:hypothetical protein